MHLLRTKEARINTTDLQKDIQLVKLNDYVSVLSLNLSTHPTRFIHLL